MATQVDTREDMVEFEQRILRVGHNQQIVIKIKLPKRDDEEREEMQDMRLMREKLKILWNTYWYKRNATAINLSFQALSNIVNEHVTRITATEPIQHTDDVWISLLKEVPKIGINRLNRVSNNMTQSEMETSLKLHSDICDIYTKYKHKYVVQ
jgi:hypothetical protein